MDEGEQTLDADALQEAREVLDEGRAELREQAELVEERAQALRKQERELYYTHAAYRRLAELLEEGTIGLTRGIQGDHTDVLVVEQVQTRQRGTTAEPFNQIVLRPGMYPDSGRLELTEPELEQYPTDPSEYREFGLLVGATTTWAEVEAEAAQKAQYWREDWTEVRERLSQLERRAEAYDEVLERLALGQPLPWDEDDTAASGAGDEAPPIREARVVFAERSRAPASKTYIAGEVAEWATDAVYWYLRNGAGAEQAKDRVLGIAEQHDYHFGRRTLERRLEG